ncbi:MAG: bifunctional hydroxymethylpyrimidine kinase/phosphomethylpyrimidine kinase [Pyrinomonadaceae bacterium]
MNFAKDHTQPPVCMTIAGLDPSGGAGIIADIKSFSAFGCFAAAAVTSVTFQNTTGVFGAVHQTAESVRRQAEAVVDDFEVAALKTGMLPTGEVIDEVARLIKTYSLRNIIVDPVVRSTSGFDLIDDAALEILIERLFPLADLITPNIPEAERIAKMSIASSDDIAMAAEKMRTMGARNVLIKGGHFTGPNGEKESGENRGKMAVDHLFIGASLTKFEAEFIDTNATHGTGCTLAAAIAANLALGADIESAVKISKDFVTEAIRTAPNLGKGHSPINISPSSRV